METVARRWRLLPDDPDIGWIPYIWLAYLAFVFAVPLAFAPTDDPVVYVASIGATLLFLPLYFAAYWFRGGARLGLALAMAAIGAALAPLNAGSNTFFIYAGFFAGMAAQTTIGGILRVALLLAMLAATAIVREPSPYFWIPAAFGIAIIGLIGVQQVQRDRVNATLRLAREEVDALARIAERERIGRDLHDLLGQSLSVVALKAELAEKLAGRDPGRAALEMADVRRVAREALGEVRTAVRGYRVGSGAGLQQEIDRAERALAAADVELSCAEGPATIADRLDAAHEGVLALVLREATTNVIRHARARTCTLRFFGDADAYGLEIVDDGRGLGMRPGHGLTGMRARVEAVGGILRLEPAAPGTRVLARFATKTPTLAADPMDTPQESAS
jgi:two-component system, NarL family, sensor histidine kinase DesK